MKYGYDLSIFRDTGLKIPIKLPINTHCHTLLTGSSGSGKSYGLLYLLGMLLKSYPDIIIFFCDFKSSTDYRFLEQYVHYYAGNDTYNGIMDYYRLLSDARKNGSNTKRHLLIFDEYSAFINFMQMQDKANKTKYTNEVLSAIYETLALGRGTGGGFGCWIIVQRADSTLFPNGCRESFMNIISLGRTSREQHGMLFTGEELPSQIYHKGEGLILSDGHPLREIKLPCITDIDNWKQHILSILVNGGCA